MKTMLSMLLAASMLLLGNMALAVEPESAVMPAEAPPVSEQAKVLDLNTASAEELSAVMAGVGEAKAQAIIDYRTARGPFTSVDDLLEVKGIGPATLEKNRSHLTVIRVQ